MCAWCMLPEPPIPMGLYGECSDVYLGECFERDIGVAPDGGCYLIYDGLLLKTELDGEYEGE